MAVNQKTILKGQKNIISDITDNFDNISEVVDNGN